MSFEKVVASGEITFYYTMLELFNKQSLWSMYAVEHKMDSKDESILDLMSLTDDEQDMAESLLEDGVFDVFNRFLKYTSGITDAILFNTSYTTAGAVTADCVVLKIKDHEAYNINYLTPVDKLLEKCLRFYVLKEWFLLKDLDANAAKAGVSYNNNLRMLLRHSFVLKKVKLQ